MFDCSTEAYKNAHRLKRIRFFIIQPSIKMKIKTKGNTDLSPNTVQEGF